jgi:hypothetical protein
MERVNGFVKLRNNHQQILVHVMGKPKRWRSRVSEEGGRLFVKVAVDLAKQSWDVKVKGYDLFAPVSWSSGLYIPCSLSVCCLVSYCLLPVV